MSYSYYPGCSLHSTGAEYDVSIKFVFKKLGIEFEEIKGWNCCGTTPAHCTSKYLSIALPARNLKLVEDSGNSKVAVPCASCFSRLKRARYEISQDKELAQKVNEIIEADFSNTVDVIHPLDIIKNDIGIDRLKEKMEKSLSGIRVACYYGCLMTRPPEVTEFDNCEYPVIMDEILSEMGAEPIDWGYKTDCCGASFSISRISSSLKLMSKIFKDVASRGADCISVACPLCHANLDTRQEDINNAEGTKYSIPVFYFSELLALALGAKKGDLAFRKHIIDPSVILQQYDIG
ncbi:MAG: heterodisulfide reductase subunit B [Candidatus Schekmanbacteria bacterium]|nr:MAG: heterodisulfide reductase subunit B [Candidatus Schekmanbacteria bacterium]